MNLVSFLGCFLCLVCEEDQTQQIIIQSYNLRTALTTEPLADELHSNQLLSSECWNQLTVM